MDDLDAKLIAERDRLVALLTELRQSLGDLSVERLTKALPILTEPCAELERAARRAGIVKGGSISGASILP